MIRGNISKQLRISLLDLLTVVFWGLCFLLLFTYYYSSTVITILMAADALLIFVIGIIRKNGSSYKVTLSSIDISWILLGLFIILRTKTWNTFNIKVNVFFLLGILFFIGNRNNSKLGRLTDTAFLKTIVLICGLTGLLFPITGMRGGITQNADFCILLSFIGLSYSLFLYGKKAKYILVFLFFLVPLFLGSRSNVIVFPLSVLLAYLISEKKTNLSERFLRALKIVFAGLILYVISYYICKKLNLGIYNRMLDTFIRYTQFQDISNGRSLLYSAAINDLKNNPLVGTGWLTYSLNHRFNAGAIMQGSQVHNLYLQLLAEDGIIGTFIFIVPFIRCLRKSVVLAKQARDRNIYSMFVFLISIQIYYLIDSFFHTTYLNIIYITVYFISVTFVYSIMEAENEKGTCLF